MHRLGLKLWSTNIDYYLTEAQKLYEDKVFDYIELYVVPNTTQYIQKWKNTKIPFVLHAPHFMHEVNLADESKREYNSIIYNELLEFKNQLNAKYIVFHGGTEGCIDETIQQLSHIVKDFPACFLIENKPYRAPLGRKKICRGANIEEIKKVIEAVGCGFCLDIGHAFCTANVLNIEPYNYLKLFNSLSPQCYHISDNDINTSVDNHMHIGSGTIDFEKVMAIISSKCDIAIETDKSSKYNLLDFCEDIKKIKAFL